MLVCHYYNYHSDKYSFTYEYLCMLHIKLDNINFKVDIQTIADAIMTLFILQTFQAVQLTKRFQKLKR